MKRFWVFAPLLALLPTSVSADPITTIDVWVRPVKGEPAKRAIDPRRVGLETTVLHDVQYAKKLKFRGVGLEKLVGAIDAPDYVDAVIVHTANGMAVPVWLNELDRLFVAFEWVDPSSAKPEPMDWKNEFPAPVEPFSDRGKKRLIVFGKNKVVYSRARATGDQTFLPWNYADSLVGLELVKRTSYDRQFLPKKASKVVKAGFAVYKSICQACHGAYKTGAKFGWDLVDPVPLAEHRKSAGNLFYHVRYREIDAPNQGIMMPAIPSFTEKKAKQLMPYLQAIAKSPLQPYRVGGAP